jgi:lipopolysaccharide transport system permease protein
LQGNAASDGVVLTPASLVDGWLDSRHHQPDVEALKSLPQANRPSFNVIPMNVPSLVDAEQLARASPRHGGLAEDEPCPAPPLGTWTALREVWQHRRYFWFFCRRAVNFRYKQALCGWLWLFVRSFFWMLPFSFVVGQVAQGTADGVPYTLFVLVGLTLWNYLSNGVSFATLGLRYERDVVRQLGLPPMLPVITNVALVLIELIVSLVILYAIGLVYYCRRGEMYLALSGAVPLALLWIAATTLLATGVGFVTAVLDDFAPDIRILVPYLVSFWMLLTPVIYPLQAIDVKYRWLAWLNPMTPIVEGFRRSVLGVGHVDGFSLLWAVAAGASVFMMGAWFFVRAQAAQRYGVRVL